MIDEAVGERVRKRRDFFKSMGATSTDHGGAIASRQRAASASSFASKLNSAPSFSSQPQP